MPSNGRLGIKGSWKSIRGSMSRIVMTMFPLCTGVLAGANWNISKRSFVDEGNLHVHIWSQPTKKWQSTQKHLNPHNQGCKIYGPTSICYNTPWTIQISIKQYMIIQSWYHCHLLPFTNYRNQPQTLGISPFLYGEVLTDSLIAKLLDPSPRSNWKCERHSEAPEAKFRKRRERTGNAAALLWVCVSDFIFLGGGRIRRLVLFYYTALRITGPCYRGVWMCIAGVWDLQTTSFEIPWFLGCTNWGWTWLNQGTGFC